MNMRFRQSFLTMALVWTLISVPVATIAQKTQTAAKQTQETQIVAPKNKYKPADDIKLGRQAAAESEKVFPVIHDQMIQNYIQSVGERLVAAIPAEFQHPEFNYRFQVVNVSDLNAFALPGGPMYVNRGMIQAAHNEGELAGVMAHELSHVALRHSTAQATKQNSVGNQLGMLGMILGGAMVGGQSGAQLGQMGAQAWMTKYSREYESQADLLGSHMMAAADYDPHDLANVFQMLAQQSGGRGAPQWLSTHPDPGNRYNRINAEAAMLTVSPNPIKMTRDFERVKARLAAMPPARSMQQLQQEYQQSGGRPNVDDSGAYGGGGYPNGSGNGGYGNGGYGNGGYGNGGYGNGSGQGQSQNPAAGGRYTKNVELPSQQMKVYSNAGLSVRVPDNWRELSSSQSQVEFAPEGAYGDQGITHGVMIGVTRASSGDSYQATQDYVNSLLQGNVYLRQRGNVYQTTFGGHNGSAVQLGGTSDITGTTELVNVYTTVLPSGVMVYLVSVVPQNESSQYLPAFRSMLNSLRLNQ